MATTLMVWIREDGLWVVKEDANHFGTTIVFDGVEGAGHGPDMGKGVARVPDSLIDQAVDAASDCPGECIMIEPYDQATIDGRGV
jgi:ferredoxin